MKFIFFAYSLILNKKFNLQNYKNSKKILDSVTTMGEK